MSQRFDKLVTLLRERLASEMVDPKQKGAATKKAGDHQ